METSSQSEVGDYLILNFRVQRDRRIELLPSFHLPGSIPPSTSSPEERITIELRGADQQSLVFHRCHEGYPGHSAEGSLDFHEVLPWNRETAYLRFLLEDDEERVIEVEKAAPEITTPPRIALEGQTATCRWDARQRDRRGGAITYLVRYSSNGGATWLAVAAELTDPRLVVDLDSLPGGERCIFQVVASTGIRTTVAESAPLPVRRKPRQPRILWPKPDAVFRQGDPVLFGGLGFSPDFGTAPIEETVWTSNIAGVLGFGFDVIATTLPRGVHIVKLGVGDGFGGEAVAHVRIRIAGSDIELRDADGFHRPTEQAGGTRLVV